MENEPSLAQSSGISNYLNIRFDIFMNLVLDHCKELIPGQGAENKDNLYPGFSNVTDQLVDIGQAVVRGNAIIMWECLDRVRD